MTETGIILPWWLISLLAGVLMTMVVWQRQQLRRICWQALGASCEALDRWRGRCAMQANVWQQRTHTAFSVFTAHLASTRYRLAMVDYMQLLTRRWQTVEKLCKDSDLLIARAYQELEAAHMEKPEAPEWVVAVDAIGGLPGGNSQPATAKILQAMLQAAESQHAEAMREFRWAAALRGRALLASARYWRQLKVRLAAIEDFGRALKSGEQTLDKASARVEVLELQDDSRHLSALFGGLVAGALLALGIWFSLFVLAAQQRLIDNLVADAVLVPGWAAIWPSLYLLVLLLVGATAASTARVTDIFARVAELGFRWRVRLGLLCVFVLGLLSAGGMSIVVADMQVGLLTAGWTELSAGIASGVLYALPLFLSLQLCVMAYWFRASKPLTYRVLEYGIRSCEKLLAGCYAVLFYLRAGIKLEGAEGGSEDNEGSVATAEETQSMADGIKLVSDLSSQKTG